MSYIGQTHTVPVRIASYAAAEVPDVTSATIAVAFDEAYRSAFGRLLEGIGTRIVNLRTAVIGTRPKFDLGILAPAADASLADARLTMRRVFAQGAWHDAAVFARLALPVGSQITGPAILQQPDTTVFVDPGLTATVDRLGNLVMRRGAAARNEAVARFR
jgi:N-methylhydantoinase A